MIVSILRGLVVRYLKCDIFFCFEIHKLKGINHQFRINSLKLGEYPRFFLADSIDCNAFHMGDSLKNTGPRSPVFYPCNANHPQRIRLSSSWQMANRNISAIQLSEHTL